ncbi:hypothetical protein BcDW1_6662 [Botrytis cinerea BcDW1]|uniref:Uncharacterized protein n=1 Tax=Botryotinia fuckeliana (strain BcDW1) TaxID=1290391 RepID=M7UDB6_BOTF1|nr:hypothetical protein BcDW1_6662 [Botrytis cinerea BcDW1]
MLLQRLLLLGFAAGTSAIPARHVLSDRDNGICSAENMKVDVSDYNCPKKNTLDSKGYCSKPIPNVPGKEGCSAYCEIRLTLKYGQEMPMSGASCGSGTECSISTTQTISYVNTFSINAGIGGAVAKVLESAFDIGATYTFSKTLTYSDTVGSKKDLGENECGYWTFIPYVLESCGTLTEAAEKSAPAGYMNSVTYQYCDKPSYTNTPNWCNTTPYKNAAGMADGKLYFVYTYCNGTGVDWEKMQDSPYVYPGVSTAQK